MEILYGNPYREIPWKSRNPRKSTWKSDEKFECVRLNRRLVDRHSWKVVGGKSGEAQMEGSHFNLKAQNGCSRSNPSSAGGNP